MSKYFLKGRYLSNKYVEEISLEQYRKLINARKALTKALEIEGLYDNVVETYIETKAALYEMNIRGFAHHNQLVCYSQMHHVRGKLNRLFVNALNFSKFYLDKHVYAEGKKSYVMSITGDESMHKAVLELRDAFYYEDKYYRFGCDLRNHSQHKALPINNLSLRLSNSDTPTAAFNITLPRDSLKKLKFCKENLNRFEDKIDLHKVLDGYISAISQMHFKSRALCSDTIREAEQTINNQLLYLKEKYNEQSLHSDLFCNDQLKQTLALDWFVVHEELCQKNSSPLGSGKVQHIPYLNSSG
ncbi:hypothetical protein Q8W40_13700 [Vibrio penaeicida]|uniref:hypothetical protein n=1 Tax=Vibrio penaeicida TaxID=104609 RepID=UPI0027339256|nr:hypothetical protein [Vibrio penaeicida]MDP2573241.1 hypothetical protein [Vibrio penaeicida]